MKGLFISTIYFDSSFAFLIKDLKAKKINVQSMMPATIRMISGKPEITLIIASSYIQPKNAQTIIKIRSTPRIPATILILFLIFF